MITFLNTITLLFWLFGVVVFVGSKGAPHEIEALILLLIGFVTCCGAAVLDRLDKIKTTTLQYRNASAGLCQVSMTVPNALYLLNLLEALSADHNYEQHRHPPKA